MTYTEVHLYLLNWKGHKGVNSTSTFICPTNKVSMQIKIAETSGRGNVRIGLFEKYHIVSGISIRTKMLPP